MTREQELEFKIAGLEDAAEVNRYELAHWYETAQRLKAENLVLQRQCEALMKQAGLVHDLTMTLKSP